MDFRKACVKASVLLISKLYILQYFEFLERVHAEYSKPLLRNICGQGQARANNQVHTNADVSETEIVQCDIRGKHATEYGNTQNIIDCSQLLWHVPHRCPIHGNEEQQKEDERHNLLQCCQCETSRAPSQTILKLKLSIPLRNHGACWNSFVNLQDPTHEDIHEGLSSEIQHEFCYD